MPTQKKEAIKIS